MSVWNWWNDEYDITPSGCFYKFYGCDTVYYTAKKASQVNRSVGNKSAVTNEADTPK